MISCNLEIKNSVGLHARPATFFIQKANSFKSSIWVEKENCRVNAKSLLGVLSLGITKGSVITLIADGQDEQAALDGLSELIDSGWLSLSDAKEIAEGGKHRRLSLRHRAGAHAGGNGGRRVGPPVDEDHTAKRHQHAQ